MNFVVAYHPTADKAPRFYWHYGSGTDTGDGMTDRALEGCINKLSSSSSQQTHDGNYGVGAKISTALANPIGLRYRSWKEGRGHEILLCRDTTGRYGLRQYAIGNDEFSYSPRVPEGSKPAMIETHGIEVTLVPYATARNGPIATSRRPCRQKPSPPRLCSVTTLSPRHANSSDAQCVACRERENRL